MLHEAPFAVDPTKPITDSGYGPEQLSYFDAPSPNDISPFWQATISQIVPLGPSTWVSAPTTMESAATPVEFALSGGRAPTQTTASVAAAVTSPSMVAVTGSGNLTFDLQWDSSVGNAPSWFTTAVEEAATFYANNFTAPNPTTLTIDVGWGEVEGVAGSIPAGAVSASADNGDFLSYNALYGALQAEANNYASGSVLNNYFKSELPTPKQFQTATGKNPSTADFFVTYSEEEALGLTPNFYYGEPDGFIGLSSAVSWNTSDTSLQQTGANGGGYDAVGAAASEIGEVLGRLQGGGNSLGLGKGALYTLLDLSRFKASNNARDFSYSTAGYFSLTGGVAALGLPADLGKYQSGLFGGDHGDWNTSTPGDAFGLFASGQNQPMSATDVLETASLGFQLTSTGLASAANPKYI